MHLQGFAPEPHWELSTPSSPPTLSGRRIESRCFSLYTVVF